MANLSENPQWVDGIYQIETSDPVVGGPDGVSNRQAKELASRTSYLKKSRKKRAAIWRRMLPPPIRIRNTRRRRIQPSPARRKRQRLQLTAIASRLRRRRLYARLVRRNWRKIKTGQIFRIKLRSTAMSCCVVRWETV